MIKEDIETIENAKEFIQSTIDAVKKDGSCSTKLRCIGTLCGGVEFDSSQAVVHRFYITVSSAMKPLELN
jgi:hypothetical protein